MLKIEWRSIMRSHLKTNYQLDIGGWKLCPSARFGVRGNGNLPPNAPRNDESISSLIGNYQQRSQNVINSLEDIILGSDWQKLDTMVNAIALVHFLHEQGLYILSFNFLPETNNIGNLYWILQIDIYAGKPRDHKRPHPLVPAKKRRIKSLVLQWMEQSGIKESDLQILEERE